MDNPVPAPWLEGDVVHHRQFRRSDHQVLDLWDGFIRDGFFDGAVGHAYSLAPETILAFVARIVRAEAHVSFGQGFPIDFCVFRPIVARQLQGGRGGTEIRIVRIDNFYPRTLTGSSTQPSSVSSPTRIVPHSVRRTGSHESRPLMTVSTAPVASRTRWTPGSASPSSLQRSDASGLNRRATT